MNVLIVAIENENHDGLQQMVNAANQSAVGNGCVTLCSLMPFNQSCERLVGLDEIFICRKKEDYPWESDQVREVVWDIMTTKEFDLILFENSEIGEEVCVRLACEKNGESVLNIINVEFNGAVFSVIKPVYSSNLNAVYRIKKTPCFITLRSGTKIEVPAKIWKLVHETEICYKQINKQSIIYRDTKKVAQNLLESAKRVVVAGRGIKNAQDLQLLQQFARHINAELGGTRPLVMNGLINTERLIGQSGKIIAPDICIAIGVSGVSPLAVGIKQSKKIIAINKDGEAPIFKIADIGVVADYHDALADLYDITADDLQAK